MKRVANLICPAEEFVIKNQEMRVLWGFVDKEVGGGVCTAVHEGVAAWVFRWLEHHLKLAGRKREDLMRSYRRPH